MANIKQTIAQRKAEAEKAAEETKRNEWTVEAEKALSQNGKIVRDTVQSLAKQIHAGGYPKNLTFHSTYGGVNVVVADEKDLATFWKNVYANLSKAELAKLAEDGHEPITEQQVCDSLMRMTKRVKVANELNDNEIVDGIQEFESDGEYYVVASGMVIDLDGQVRCDVSDLNQPYGPEEWVEIANRLRQPKPETGERPEGHDEYWYVLTYEYGFESGSHDYIYDHDRAIDEYDRWESQGYETHLVHVTYDDLDIELTSDPKRAEEILKEIR